MKDAVKIVYFESVCGPPPAPYRAGDAGVVWLSDEGLVETDSRVAIPPNSLHALWHHEVIERLNELDLQLGPIGEGRDALIAPGCARAAARVFYEADRMTYGAEYEALVAAARAPEWIEYRLRIDNREYQRTLSRLQFLCNGAATMGHGLRLRV